MQGNTLSLFFFLFPIGCLAKTTYHQRVFLAISAFITKALFQSQLVGKD